jgi:hypothetical protein
MQCVTPSTSVPGVTESEQPYNPLDRVELGKSVERALLARPLEELETFLARSRRAKFAGAGLYTLYYVGGLPDYAAITAPQPPQPGVPIYAGRAQPPGARQGALGLDSTTSEPVLFDRLREHANSVRSVEQYASETGQAGLRVSDFRCRHLVADDIWVPMGEAVLIGHYRPVWNVAVGGFGNHGVGGGREQQARSSWDVLHPGRKWALRLSVTRSIDEIRSAIAEHFETTARPDLDAPPVLDEAVMRALVNEGGVGAE